MFVQADWEVPLAQASYVRDHTAEGLSARDAEQAVADARLRAQAFAPVPEPPQQPQPQQLPQTQATAPIISPVAREVTAPIQAPVQAPAPIAKASSVTPRPDVAPAASVAPPESSARSRDSNPALAATPVGKTVAVESPRRSILPDFPTTTSSSNSASLSKRTPPQPPQPPNSAPVLAPVTAKAAPESRSPAKQKPKAAQAPAALKEGDRVSGVGNAEKNNVSLFIHIPSR